MNQLARLKRNLQNSNAVSVCARVLYITLCKNCITLSVSWASHWHCHAEASATCISSSVWLVYVRAIYVCSKCDASPSLQLVLAKVSCPWLPYLRIARDPYSTKWSFHALLHVINPNLLRCKCVCVYLCVSFMWTWDRKMHGAINNLIKNAASMLSLHTHGYLKKCSVFHPYI